LKEEFEEFFRMFLEIGFKVFLPDFRRLIVPNGTKMIQFVTEKSQYLKGIRIYRKSHS